LKNLKKEVRPLIKRALKEDLGKGDITTDSLFQKDKKIKAYLLAKQNMVMAGSWVFEDVFKALGGKLKFKWLKKDGRPIKKNSTICRIEGSLKNLLKGERVALNFLQRLSGIATLTECFVTKVSKTKTKILDTRKTTPGLRKLEKYATSIGGAKNHRMGLFDSILIKDNHIAPLGSVKNTLETVKKKRLMKNVEIETKNLKEVRQAVNAGAGIIMLDNMGPKMIRKAVKIIGKKAKVEISGGVNLSNIRKLSECGVDYISIGALTHSPESVDISLKIE